MKNKSKLKFLDDNDLRTQILLLSNACDQKSLANWSMSLAKHNLDLLSIDWQSNKIVTEAIEVSELWQKDQASVPEVRSSALSVHKLARETNLEVEKLAYRAIGHAVAIGHVGDHAIIASDYAIKSLGLFKDGNMGAITQERKWQLDKLKLLIKANS